MGIDPRLKRMYALAFLLSGSRGHAVDITRHAIGLRPEFELATAVELDRLIVLASRELGLVRTPEHPPSGHEAIRLFESVLSLRPSVREAWILRDVIELDATHAARAMDCSKVALSRFVETARAELGADLNADALAELRRLADAVGAGDSVAQLSASLGREIRRERRSNQILFALAALVVLWVTVEYVCWRAVG